MANNKRITVPAKNCNPGAVPALGAAYGLNVVVDDSLARQPTSTSRAATAPIWSISAERAFRS